jgi:hypothetical protein
VIFQGGSEREKSQSSLNTLRRDFM